MISEAAQLPVEGRLPSLAGATGWLNSPPLTAEELRGKVVLIDVWTYTCINWRRTLPYLRAWIARYQQSGLVLIGVHSPEFPFERDVENVRRVSREIGVDYPIALDNDYSIWEALDNHYWPALFIVDTEGRIRHHQFGEGRYDEAERVIQQLLVESGRRGIDPQLVQVDARGAEADADWADLRSPENYLGVAQTEGFSSPGGIVRGTRHLYVSPPQLEVDQWGLAGSWTVDDRRARLDEAGGRIDYRFHARDLHLVMGPPTRGKPVHFRVFLDGKPPGASHGVDVDAAGNGTAKEQRMYQLIRQSGTVDDRRFKIEFLDPGVEAFAFSFG